MDINLTIYDMDLFLDKYTRFMTKNIYISNKMYCNFLKQYDYLYQILERDRFLYNDNKKYKKIMDIKLNKMKLIKLHNQKYLKEALNKYQSFFDEIDEKLDIRKRMIILSEEESTYVVEFKNYISLVINKLKFLIQQKKYLSDNILILTKDLEEAKKLCIECRKIDADIKVLTFKEYGNSLLNNEEVLDIKKQYDILFNYIVNDLFPDKNRFNSFYKVFSKYIYLNKDYKDYETFKDYHNYMYKRKYLSSKLSLKKFNEEEIKKRKSFLRTIKNDNLKYKEEVDIANFLYLNSVSYVYDYQESSFKLLDKKIYIKYINEKEKDNRDIFDGDIIYLYSSYNDDNTYLSVLAYELIKRRYSLELVLDDDLYNELRDANIDNYFSEFIYKYLIPLIDYYSDNKSFGNINMNEDLKNEFLELYNKYNYTLENNNLITEKELLKRVEEEIQNSKYKYLFLIGDIELDCSIPMFMVVDNYQETELIKESIKLLYDYRKYLYDNQVIPISQVYLNKEEIKRLTKCFLKDNLKIINKFLEENNKEIKICEYDDNNRLHVYRNISDNCARVLEEYNDRVLIAFNDLKNINILIGNNNFVKKDKKTLLFKNKNNIEVEEVLKINKIYDTIVLPYLIRDYYHDNLFKDDYQYSVKVMLYVALSKCRNRLVLLCPSSKKAELDQLLGNLKK